MARQFGQHAYKGHTDAQRHYLSNVNKWVSSTALHASQHIKWQIGP
jgi:hypothetical protein